MDNKGLVANCSRISGTAERRGIEMLGYLTLMDNSELAAAVLSHASGCAQCAKLVWEGQNLWMRNHSEFNPDPEWIETVRGELQRRAAASSLKNGQSVDPEMV